MDSFLCVLITGVLLGAICFLCKRNIKLNKVNRYLHKDNELLRLTMQHIERKNDALRQGIERLNAIWDIKGKGKYMPQKRDSAADKIK